MKEIIEFNKKLRTRIPRLAEDADGVTISREDSFAEWGVIPEDLRPSLALIVGELNRVIPDDFSYSIYFGDREPYFGISFKDGVQSGSFRNTPCFEDETIAEAFSGIEWDEQRQGAMEECQIFDQIKERTAKVPARIPSTKRLRKVFAEEIKPWVKAVRKNADIVHVMMWREDEDLVKEEFGTLDAFADELPNIMTVQYQVVAVVTDGKPLPSEKVDAMKRRALKSLEGMPISYAKASGRLSGISTLIPEFKDDEND